MNKPILGTLRLPFVIMAPACAVLGLATAIYTNGKVNGWHFVLALIGAIGTHLSVNIFNEYFDFKSGLDAITTRTPFSGGSGVLPEHPELEKPTFRLAWSVLIITAAIGIFFAVVQGWQIIPIGIIGLFLTYTYTPWISKNKYLTLIAPGLGVGILLVMGTDFVLTGEFTWTSFIASLVPFFLVNNLLLLNQFPDKEADEEVGRKNFPIAHGRKASSYIYTFFMLLAYASIVWGILADHLPIWAALGFITILIALPASFGAIKNADDLPKLAPSLGMNVLISILTPILVAIGLFIS